MSTCCFAPLSASSVNYSFLVVCDCFWFVWSWRSTIEVLHFLLPNIFIVTQWADLWHCSFYGFHCPFATLVVGSCGLHGSMFLPFWVQLQLTYFCWPSFVMLIGTYYKFDGTIGNRLNIYLNDGCLLHICGICWLVDRLTKCSHAYSQFVCDILVFGFI
jgi:hypothetical protein